MNPKKIHVQDYKEIEARGKRLEALINLSEQMREKDRRNPIPYNDFLYLISVYPELILRDIFQLFHDMVIHYAGSGVEEYPDHEESIGYLNYDSESLFVEGVDNPFFADRLFMNRLANLAKAIKEGSMRNHIFLFEGPPGSGKSTFLNNLLLKLEEFTATDAGTFYKTYWSLDVEKLGGYRHVDRTLSDIADEHDGTGLYSALAGPQQPKKDYQDNRVEFSCPRHDHPILQIPREYRKEFLDELISDEEFKEKLFYRKEYEWVLKDKPCHICKSLYDALLDTLGDPMEVYSMIRARKMHFNRQFGEGISINNPGDSLIQKPITNPTLQKILNELLKTDKLDFIYSDLAKTNNGVLALMDVKENNVERLKNLHGVISDGVHKVEQIEEYIKSLFMGIVNPEDKIHYENIQSFRDRVINVNISYILDYNTEVKIYKNKFGKQITQKFLPRVLENFAKIIVSSRLDKASPAIQKWIQNPNKYSKYLDKYYMLLKMDIYTGTIPDWLMDEDLKKFDRDIRKQILQASEKEGKKGISGRMSINVFNRFYTKYAKDEDLITMDMLKDFFSEQKDKEFQEIPDEFTNSLVDMYDYNVLQEVKEAIYYYNEDQISRDIRNYLFAINFDLGNTEYNEDTGDTIEITEDYFKNFEALFLGTTSTEGQRKVFREDVHRTYIRKTLAQDLRVKGMKLNETEQFKELFEKYSRNLKENALARYLDNENFRRAVKEFGTTSFNNYDERMKRDITRMIENLKKKFSYNEEGAKQISLYVLDKNLAKKY